MSIARYPRFTDPLFLKQIGRPLLEQFLQRFRPALASRTALLPPPEALDQEFFNIMAHLLMSPESLPDEMNEAMHVIKEMATPEGQQRIETLMQENNSGIEFPETATREDMVLQLWLAEPDLLARARNLHRLSKLSTFHHFGCESGNPASPRSLELLQRVDLIEAKCDAWFAAHNRGRHNTQIQVYALPSCRGMHSSTVDPELWFLIRHGGTYVRRPKIECGKTGVLLFRPLKDDLAVLGSDLTQLRINARTLGERDLYRAAFGEHVFGDPNAFSKRLQYNLAPLVTIGEDALHTREFPGLLRAVLKGVEICLPGENAVRITCKGSDIFNAIRQAIIPAGVPGGAELTQAWFDLCFENDKEPRPIHLRPPNTLRLSRRLDPALVEHWLTLRGFRIEHAETPLCPEHLNRFPA